MKESYKVRPSQSPWPRVMRDVGQPAGRSVYRGTTRAVYGAPKTSFCGGRPCPDKGKAIVMSNINGESDVTPTESKTTGTVGYFSHGSRETPATSASPMEADRPVAPHAAPSQPTRTPLDLGKVLEALHTLAPDTEDPSPYPNVRFACHHPR